MKLAIMKLVKNCVLVALLGFSSLTMAQDIGITLEKANNAFEDGFHYTAIKYFEQALIQKGLDEIILLPYNQYGRATDSIDFKDFMPSVERLAESYRMVYDFENAEKWYKIYMELEEEPEPEIMYEYALCLRANGKFPAALEQLNTAEAKPIPSELAEKIRFEIQCAEFAVEAKESEDLHEITVLNDKVFNPINSGNYAPSHIYGNDFLFTSTRETRDVNAYDGTIRYYHSLKVYQNGNLYDYSFEELDEEKEYEIASASISGDEKRLYFNMWVPDGKPKDIETPLSIYMAVRINDVTWSKPILLDTLLGGEDGEVNKYPFVSKDGSKLYFSSVRKDGLGGLDIYEISLNGAGMPLGEPRNLGSAVNSSGNDISPFFDEENNLFYFASDGRIGMGGFDNYVAEYVGGSFGAAENLGYPMNSEKDDAFLVITDGNTGGLLSSDREKGCCYEIFEFKMFNRSATGYVFNQFDQTPVEGAKMTLTDTLTGKVIETVRTDVSGKYIFEVNEERNYFVEAEHPFYFDGDAYFNTMGIGGKDTAFVPPIIIIPTDTGKPIDLPNVEYDFGSADLRPESYPTLDFLAEQMIKRPLLIAEIGSHTDNVGSDAANMKLSIARAKSVVEYLMSVGVPENQITYKGYGESVPLVPNENPDGSDNEANRQRNRRTEFKIIAAKPVD